MGFFFLFFFPVLGEIDAMRLLTSPLQTRCWSALWAAVVAEILFSRAYYIEPVLLCCVPSQQCFLWDDFPRKEASIQFLPLCMFWSLKFCGAIFVRSCPMFCCCPENFTYFLWNAYLCIFPHLKKNNGCSVLFCKLSVAGFLTLQNLLSNFSSFLFIAAANVRRFYLFSGPSCPSQPTFAWFPKNWENKRTCCI